MWTIQTYVEWYTQIRIQKQELTSFIIWRLLCIILWEWCERKDEFHFQIVSQLKSYSFVIFIKQITD